MATIEVRIRTLAQLFDSLDPSPFHERGLDRYADSYIVECAGEFPPDAALQLMIHAPEDVRSHIADAAQAIHAHYGLARAQADRRHRRRMRAGSIALLIGAAVMIASLAVRMLLGEWITTPVGQVVGEGLLILSWVVLWRPAELLLFERWESRHERQVLERLSNIPVAFAASAAERQ